jgi:hypothetical protein
MAKINFYWLFLYFSNVLCIILYLTGNPHCSKEAGSFMEICDVKYTFTYGPERILTHNLISSPIQVAFSSADLHMTAVSNYDFDRKQCTKAVTSVTE